MHKPVGTIKGVVNSIGTNEYVLPSIQRELVWNREQICNLFDSVMQGYPFGELLFWQIDSQNSHRYKWYGFVRDYHQRDNPHCPELGIFHDRSLTAILDGQQRLTAFNIGLRGTMAVKLPHKWWNSPDAFPRTVLALDLLGSPDPDEDERQYIFDFIDENKLGFNGEQFWFKVADILRMSDGPEMLSWIKGHGVDDKQDLLAYQRLDRLFRAICQEESIHCYEVRDQEMAQVLNIFTRCNSGGTPLSYSDLLLSTAVSQWQKLDARKEVYGLVDELNRVRDGLFFNKDFVLKAGLMLTDIASVGFKLENFTHSNMLKLEDNWPRVRLALIETAQLIDSFGFDNRTVQALNSLLPIAYYLYQKGAPGDFETSDHYREERQAIRGWLTRSILKESGIWGSGLDTLLTALRQVIRDHDANGFPAAELRRVMAGRGKSLDFVEEEIDDLADMGVGDRRIFPLLTMLFPHLESRSGTDVDHIFPRSRFTRNLLENVGVNEEQIEEFQSNRDRVANLQLLDHTVNNEKRATLPAEWLDKHLPNVERREYYCERHRLGKVPKSMVDFMQFYSDRRENLRNHIAKLVNSV